MSVGTAISMESRAGRSAGRLLPNSSGRPSGPQQAAEEVLPVSDTDAARLAKLEGKAETYDRMFVKMSDTLDSINAALNKLVALEERHQALDTRHQQLRTDFTASMNRGGERMGKLEDRMRDIEGDSNPSMKHVRELEGRVREVEGKVTINAHGRSMWERIIAPLIASTISGGLVAIAVYMFLQSNVPAG